MMNIIIVSINCIVCDEGPSIFAHLLTIFSCLMIAATMPLSLFFVVKVVQVTFCYFVYKDSTKKCTVIQ